MRRRQWGLVAALPTFLIALLSGCGSDDNSGGSAQSPARSTSLSPTASDTPTGAVGMLATCAPTSAKPFVAEVRGGHSAGGVNGMILGRGNRAVVLSYEWGSSPCAWSDIAIELAGKGYQVALWEYGSLTGLDRVSELQAVVDQVRRNGAKKVALAGGSLGGCVSMIGASTVRPTVSAVAVFSCASWYDVQHRLPTTPWATKVRVPTLYVTGADDKLPVAEVRKDFAGVPSKDKKLVVVPNSAMHGVALLTDAAAARLAKPALLTFLDRVTG